MKTTTRTSYNVSTSIPGVKSEGVSSQHERLDAKQMRYVVKQLADYPNMTVRVYRRRVVTEVRLVQRSRPLTVQERNLRRLILS